MVGFLLSRFVAVTSRLMLRHPLRTGDAVQLASALTMLERTGIRTGLDFISFDGRLNAAASAEGLRIHGAG